MNHFKRGILIPLLACTLAAACSPGTPASAATLETNSINIEKVAKDSKSSAADPTDAWLALCKKIGKKIKKRSFIYSNSRTKKTWKAALSGSRRTNCALYVSWCLQEYGALKKGQTFYVRGNGSIKKNFSAWGNDVQVIRVYKPCGSVKLQKGDVVCWSGIAHCNIYAGRSKSGNRLWYDAGKSATTGGRSGSRYKKVGARQVSYLDRRRISYIIRIKDLA